MAYELMARNTTITVGCVGDSITAGTMVSTPPTAILQGAINRGVSGTTSFDWLPSGPYLSAAKAAFVSAGVRLVNIMLGTNDAKTSVATTQAAYRANLLAICEDLAESGFAVAVSYPPYLAATSGAFDAISPARVASYCASVDSLTDGGRFLRGDTLAYTYFQLNPSALGPDGVHPRQVGSDFLGHLWEAALQPVITVMAGESVPVAIDSSLSLTMVNGIPTLAAAGNQTPPPPPPLHTWSMTDKHPDIAISESGALATKSGSSAWVSARTNESFTTGGSADLEQVIEIVGDTQIIVGVATADASLSNFIGSDAYGWGLYANNGNKTHSGLAGYTTPCAIGDLIRIKLSRTGALSFERNDILLGDAFTGLSGTFMVAISVNTGSLSGGRLV